MLTSYRNADTKGSVPHRVNHCSVVEGPGPALSHSIFRYGVIGVYNYVAVAQHIPKS